MDESAQRKTKILKVVLITLLVLSVAIGSFFYNYRKYQKVDQDKVVYLEDSKVLVKEIDVPKLPRFMNLHTAEVPIGSNLTYDRIQQISIDVVSTGNLSKLEIKDAKDKKILGQATQLEVVLDDIEDHAPFNIVVSFFPADQPDKDVASFLWKNILAQKQDISSSEDLERYLEENETSFEKLFEKGTKLIITPYIYDDLTRFFTETEVHEFNIYYEIKDLFNNASLYYGKNSFGPLDSGLIDFTLGKSKKLKEPVFLYNMLLNTKVGSF